MDFLSEVNMIIGAVCAFASAVFTYFLSKKKNDADVYKTFAETYDFALKSQRDHFELRLNQLETEIEKLKKVICWNKNCEKRIKND